VSFRQDIERSLGKRVLVLILKFQVLQLRPHELLEYPAYTRLIFYAVSCVLLVLLLYQELLVAAPLGARAS